MELVFGKPRQHHIITALTGSVTCHPQYDLVQIYPRTIDFHNEDLMNILAAIRREEKKLEKQLGKLQHQLDAIRTAAKALGNSTGRELIKVRKRVLSAAGRAAISKAAKRRWAKVKAEAKKVAG